MTAKKGKPTLKWHPSLKKIFKESALWWQNNMVNRNELETRIAKLRAELDAPGPLRSAATTLHAIGHTYAIQACVSAGEGDLELLPSAMRSAVDFRALDFRRISGLSLPHSEQPVLPFWWSMKAAGPAMLSQWELADTCGRVLIDIAEKDLRVKPLEFYPDGWRRGTNDAFLIALFSEAFGIQSSFEPGRPLADEYRAVLDVWRSDDEVRFRAAMHAAAEFHISRSRDGTDKTTYEFEAYFDRVFPGELLAVQALRRRLSLPAFDSGHLLVDTPWSLIRDLPATESSHLVVETESRLQGDYPSFR